MDKTIFGFARGRKVNITILIQKFVINYFFREKLIELNEILENCKSAEESSDSTNLIFKDLKITKITPKSLKNYFEGQFLGY